MVLGIHELMTFQSVTQCLIPWQNAISECTTYLTLSQRGYNSWRPYHMPGRKLDSCGPGKRCFVSIPGSFCIMMVRSEFVPNKMSPSIEPSIWWCGGCCPLNAWRLLITTEDGMDGMAHLNIIVDEVHAFMVTVYPNSVGHVQNVPCVRACIISEWLEESFLCFSGFWHLWDYVKQGCSQQDWTDVQLTVHSTWSNISAQQIWNIEKNPFPAEFLPFVP